MADPWQGLVDWLSQIGTNPLCLISFLAFIALLLILLVVWRIHRIRAEGHWSHQPWGAKWKGR